MVIGTLGESECVILEFVVMKEGSSVVYGPTSLIGFKKHILKIWEMKDKYVPLVLTYHIFLNDERFSESNTPNFWVIEKGRECLKLSYSRFLMPKTLERT